MHSPGARPDFHAFERLAKVAEVDPKWLAFGDESPQGTESPIIDRTHADQPPPPSRAKALQRGIWEASHTVQGTEPEDYDDARLRAWGRRACSAVVSFEPELVLRVPLDAKLIVQARRIVHELGHIAADFDGVPRPHDEDWIDHVGAAVWLRRRGVRRALARWGWDGPRLLRAFGTEVPAEIIFRRVATVGGGLAILRSFEVSRRVFAPEHIRFREHARGWEKRWMRSAMYGGEQHGFEGEGAWPFRDELEGAGGLILIPPWALDTGEEPREIR